MSGTLCVSPFLIWELLFTITRLHFHNVWGSEVDTVCMFVCVCVIYCRMHVDGQLEHVFLLLAPF